MAIGLAVTTKKAKSVPSSPVGILCPFLRSFMPSFCQTASHGYRYKFYLAYDRNDKYFTETHFQRKFIGAFGKDTQRLCPINSSYSIKLVRCDHEGKPGWAQNDAMMDAYLDDADYYYRVNDDTVFETTGWTDIFIQALAKFDQPNVGVVGPAHRRGNTRILNYDFVHKTHVDIFGFYYPRLFVDIFADRWINDVYKPGMSEKLESVKLLHTREDGTRYPGSPHLGPQVRPRIRLDQNTLQRYLSL